MSTRLWAMRNCIARRDLALRSCRVSQPICWSIAVTLLVRPKLLQVYLAYRRCTISSYVCFRVWVPDSASVLQNWPNESLVGSFLDRCWCSTEIPLEEGTSVVGLLGCLVDVLRPCTVLEESHSKVLCCISHLQYMPVDVVLGDDRRWLPCDSQKLRLLGMKTHQPPTLPGLQRNETLFGGLRCLAESGSDNHQQTVNQTIISKQSDG